MVIKSIPMPVSSIYADASIAIQRQVAKRGRWEHYTPVANIFHVLIQIEAPNLEAIADIVKTARMA